MDHFVDCYNQQHRHSTIKFVTPHERYSGHGAGICRYRTGIYERARQLNPRQWSGSIRCWHQPEVVWINQPLDEPDEPQQLPMMQAALRAATRCDISLRTTQEAMLLLVRERRSIEGCPWIRDTQLHEDAGHDRGNDAGVMATLRTAALSCCVWLASSQSALEFRR